MKLGRVLGEGATAVTYEGEDSQGRQVCIKRYKTGLQRKDKEKVLREMQILKKLNHPQIPQIYDSFVHTVEGRDVLHVVQQLVDGEDLSKLLSKQKFSKRKIQTLLIDVLGILDYLHKLRPPVIHRDIKPSNIIHRLDGKVVLIDFGQAIDDIHRTYGQTLVTGTLGYQAPEQIYGETVTKSDVYSLGVLAIELLLGKKPSTMLEGQTLRWERHCRGLELPLQEWLDGVLHQDSAERWTAEKALEELGKIANVFVETSAQNPAQVSSGGVSADFLNLLDDVIIDHDEKERKQREEAYRQKIEKERKETSWKKNEQALWTEMESTWDKLISVLASGKLPVEKGLPVFVQSFAEKVQAQRRNREWGELEPKIEMLLGFAKDLSDPHMSFRYQEWLQARFLNVHEQKLQKQAKELTSIVDQLDEVERSLSSLGWFSGLLQRSALEEKKAAILLEKQGCEGKIQKIEKEIKQISQSYWEVFGKREIRFEVKITPKNLSTILKLEFTEMVLIPAGEFMMGALPDDGDAGDNEKPCHKVEITKDFYVGKYPVTQKLWKAVMGSNPSHFKGEDRPVEKVSWFDCIQFCNKLSKKEGREPVYTINGENVSCNWNANGYRLLSEAEWEYCARANQKTKYAGSNNPDGVAWYSKNSGEQTHPVGQKKPNGFGLYDMSGNVWEWCWDWYSGSDYGSHADRGTVQDPYGAWVSWFRVLRGGSWHNSAGDTRVSFRYNLTPDCGGRVLGFRLGCTP